jgi:micrococcal nuclease
MRCIPRYGILLLLAIHVCILSAKLKDNRSRARTSPLNYGEFTNAKLVDCYDGDTCKFNLADVHPLLGANINVRLIGLDAPEMRSKCKEERRSASIAKGMLLDLLTNATNIRLKNTRRDKYFRILAEVFADELDVQRVLLQSGAAIAYDGRKKASHVWCQSERGAQPTLRFEL